LSAADGGPAQPKDFAWWSGPRRTSRADADLIEAAARGYGDFTGWEMKLDIRSRA
jgi:hypothetical protein